MAAGTLRVVLGDQVDPAVVALRDIARDHDIVLMMEVQDECTYVRHHPRKISFVLSAMRHFAARLREDGVAVDYVELDDPDNSGSFRGELLRAVERHCPDRIVVTEPGEWRVQADMEGWAEACGLPVEIRADSRFLCSREAFAKWAGGRKRLRMEDFYRWMRRETGLLMDGDDPAGGRWNFDKQNRKRLPDGIEVPNPPSFAPDATTRAVLDLVGERFGAHFGRLEGFDLPVTAEQAQVAFEHFIEHGLPRFGDYQDAMAEGQPHLFHSLVSAPLNVGLLDPRDLCERAEQAWRDGAAPLNAVEGFVRQILGWREYVRGLYWLKMPDYAETNFFAADRPLPGFYWSGETDMACLRAAIGQTRDLAYAHHIQRLMVTGNFALLAGIDPAQVCEWYLIVYADAFEWVELPNTHGMALFADGGLLGSKPYAASGRYIDRMSDYCKGCRYDPGVRDGANACPFNFLYWDFLARNRDRLAGNRRMGLIYGTLDRMDAGEVEAMRSRAAAFLDNLS